MLTLPKRKGFLLPLIFVFSITHSFQYNYHRFYISGLDFGICHLHSAIKILINKQNGNLNENFALNRYVRFAFMLCNFLQNKGKH